ncbi:hypothetical protein GCM10022212_13580 [Actimicrobium antarcticum]|uniref:DUF3306 domain-containing protein n=1 Tax=Actimicrobium antarcticum TaxID=1051899 RepID=A0ABP7SZI8_9BURK
MAAEDFFARWARKPAPVESIAPLRPVESVTPAEPVAPPTLEDAAALTMSSDFTPFVARGIDEAVKRLALKKLFADPHFNIMDGLDTYIEDYNTFVPMTAEMVAELNHAKLLMNPLAHLEKPFMQMLETPPTAVVVEEVADASVDESESIEDEDTVAEAEVMVAPAEDAPGVAADLDDDRALLPADRETPVLSEPSMVLPTGIAVDRS